MARVVKRGGRVGILDIVLPDDPKISELNNRMERIRDASHTRTLAREEFESHFAAHGLRILETRVEENARSFDHWMLVAGSKPGDRPYVEARRLMEASIPNDAAWFHPRYAPAEDGGPGARADLHEHDAIHRWRENLTWPPTPFSKCATCGNPMRSQPA